MEGLGLWGVPVWDLSSAKGAQGLGGQWDKPRKRVGHCRSRKTLTPVCPLPDPQGPHPTV